MSDSRTISARVIRWSIALATLVSLLLFVTTVCFAIRSHWHVDIFGFQTAVTAEKNQWGGAIESEPGNVCMHFWSRQYLQNIPTESIAAGYSTESFKAEGIRAMQVEFKPLDNHLNFLGLGIARWQMDGGPPLTSDGRASLRMTPQSILMVILPYWILLLATSVLPLIWIIRRIGRKTAPGMCLKCGYDLRASPVRCPECGTEVSLPPNPAH